jgi:acyl-CoA reductase-like NAD-dependent aldehyde dehydrogenase
MAFAVSPAKACALRALAEGARVTLPLLADASGCALATVQALSERDGWAWAGTEAGDVAARLRAIAADLLTRMEALGRKAFEEGTKIDRTEIDGIVAIIRGLDKIGEIMRPDEAAKENQIRQDEDLAAILERIDRRIVELAKAFAAQLVAEERGLDRSETGAARLVS